MPDPNAVQTLPPPTFWFWLAGGLWGIVIVLIGTLWKRNEKDHDKTEADVAEIKSLGALKTDLAEIRVERRNIVRYEEYEQNRREFREDLITIHSKIDEVAREARAAHLGLNQKIDGVIRDWTAGQADILRAIALIKKD